MSEADEAVEHNEVISVVIGTTDEAAEVGVTIFVDALGEISVPVGDPGEVS